MSSPQKEAGLDDPNVFHVAELGTGLNEVQVHRNPHDNKKAGGVRIAVGTLSNVILRLYGRTAMENETLTI